jgi:hypothetical protein
LSCVVEAGETKDLLVTCGSGASSFQGTTANDVTTKSYGAWPRSFSFGTPAPLEASTCTGACLHNQCLVTGTVQKLTVVGRIFSEVWGDEYFSDDSDVPTVAVFLGLVQVGQTATVTATCLGPQAAFGGDTANGVTTQAYSAYWPYSYALE